MDYKKKYLIYKKKYLMLKKRQMGGTFFLSISNSGGDGSGISQQCIWISIRDYLNYHRGEITTVAELKRYIAGLGPETDQLEYDDDNVILRDGLVRLAEILGLTLYFIYTRHDGSIVPYCLNEDGSMNPARIINPGANEIVYIATFGRHFELIVQGPHYELQRNPNSTIRVEAIYEPKVNIHKTYVAKKDIRDEDQQIVQASINLVELMQNIEFFENELKRIELDIVQNQKELKNIYAYDIDDMSKALFASNIEHIIKDNSKHTSDLKKQLVKLREEQLSLEEIINS